MKNKSLLRNEFLMRRKNIKDRIIKEQAIAFKLYELNEYQNSKIVGIYYGVNSEVSTKNIINKMLEEKIVVLPRTMGNNELEFYKISSFEDLELGNYKLYEPKITCEKVCAHEIDLMIIPGICFDRKLNRVGYGKGYYDKYMESQKFKKIAICFDEQILENDLIEADQFDIKMDKIITDKRVFK